MTHLGRMAAGARNILNNNEGWDLTECRMKLKKFLYGKNYLTRECLAEKVKTFFSGKKDLGKGNDISSRVPEKDLGKGNDISSRVEAGSADHQEDIKKNKGAAILPLLSNVMVVEGTAEMGLKGVRKMVSVRDKSLKAGAAEIGNSILGLDSIESMDNVKKISTQMQLLEGKVDAEFQRLEGKVDAGFQSLELLIKSTCGGGGPRPPQSGSGGGGPRPPQSVSGGGSESDEDSSSGGFDIEE